MAAPQSSLADLASDLLNAAKMAPTAQDKLFNLEQIKEVVFHRDQSIFSHFIEDVMDFMVDKSAPVRRFLVRFGGETLGRFPVHTPAVLKLFSHLIKDENDGVAKAVLLEMTRRYGQIAMHIIGLDTRSSSAHYSKSKTSDTPRELWETLKSIETTALEQISSSRACTIRTQCIRFSISVLLFSLPREVGGDRTQKKQKRTDSDDYQLQYNVLSVPLHHAFLNREGIAEEGRILLTKIAIWATKGGPSKFPFDLEQLAELGLGLLKIASEVSKESGSILPAVTAILQTIGNDRSKKLPKGLLESLVSAASSFTGGADNEGALRKRLSEALSALQSGGSGTHIGSSVGISLISNLMNMDEDFSSEDDAEDEAERLDGGESDVEIRERALAAINSAESALRAVRASGEGAESAVSTKDIATAESRTARDTALCDDILAFPEASSAVQWKLAASGVGNEIVFKPVSSQAEVTMDSQFVTSLSYLHNLLISGFSLGSSLSTQNQLLLQKVILKLIFTLAEGELCDVALMRVESHTVRLAQISIFSNIRVTCSEMLCDPPVPLQIQLPSVLLYILGFCIQGSGEDGSVNASDVHYNKRKMELLSAIAIEIHSRSQLLAKVAFDQEKDRMFNESDCLSFSFPAGVDGGIQIDGTAEDEAVVGDTLNNGLTTDLTLYDNFCIVAFSRLFQRSQHRGHAAPGFLRSLPVIPVHILHVLKMLMHSGTLPDDAGSESGLGTRKRKRGSDDISAHLGTRIASMELLAHICLIPPVDISNTTTAVALSQLLWASTSADFRTRSNAINLIVSELVPKGAFLNDMVTLFALQSALVVVGCEPVLARCRNVREFAKGSDADALIDEGEYVSLNIEDAAIQYDDGASFFGSFQESLQNLEADEIVASDSDAKIDGGVDAREQKQSIMRRHLHLLIQLCLLNPDLLESLFNLYGCCVERSTESRASTACRIIRAELSNILPSLASSFAPDKIVAVIARSDPLARKLVLLSLDSLFANFESSVSKGTVNKIQRYAANNLKYLKQVQTKNATEALSTVDDTLFAAELLIPIVSGLSATELLSALPSIIKICFRHGGEISVFDRAAFEGGVGGGDDLAERGMKALHHAFSRMVRARSAPLSRAALLVALHRLNPEDGGLKDDEIQSAIGLCVNKKFDLDFKGAAVIEAISKLLSDATQPPPVQLMRTLLLVCRVMPDVMKHMLAEAIPRLIRGKVWLTAPRVWDGVLHALKKYYSAPSRDGVESLLRAVLGMPLKQFHIALQVCGPEVKKVLRSSLQTYSVSERGEVLSGRWVGLADDNGPSAEADKLALLEEVATTD